MDVETRAGLKGTVLLQVISGAGSTLLTTNWFRDFVTGGPME